MRSRNIARLLALLMALGHTCELLAAGHAGQVLLAGRAVPGATVTVSQGDKKFVTSTDAQGAYQLPDLPDGTWTVRVEMRGFTPITKDVTVATDAKPSTWELTMLPAADIARETVPVPALPPPPPAAASTTARTAPAAPVAPAAGSATGAAGGTSTPARPPATQPRPIAAAASSAAAAAPLDEPRPADPATGAADGFVIAGSVNNGSSSPFAQSAAFGNFRPGQNRNPYRTQLIFAGTAPFLNATPYSFTSVRTKPDTTSFNMTATLGGPLQIPGVTKRGPNFTASYSRTATDNVTSLAGRMPTLEERAGDFTQSGTTIIDPRTGLPFPGNTIPRDRISTEAAALLAYYPLPNGDPLAPTNHQAQNPATSRSHSFTFSTGRSIFNNRNQLSGSTSYNNSTSSNSNLFGFTDPNHASNLGISATWQYRMSPFLSFRVTHAFSRSTSSLTPYFAHVRNVSGDAGITGNDQNPNNWGPPMLNLAGSISSLSDGALSSSRTLGNATNADANWTRGRHNFTFGGLMRINSVDQESAGQLSRGSFLFTGGRTGSALADFLLGLPQSTSLAFGNAAQEFNARSYAAYVADDLRLRPFLTLNLGLRWEYEAPVAEALDRLVNLDVAPDFSAVAPVLASDPVGPITGQQYPRTLVRRDILGFQPRLSMAWRPILGSSLLVRAGYDRTRSSGVTTQLFNFMSQQPPLATTGNAVTSPENPLTLAQGFAGSPDITQNTFAVDPDLRIAYAQNWQVYVQRDVPASMTVSASYLGTNGGRLVRMFLPNTYLPGVANPCPACPAGFRYVTTGGSSERNAMRLEVRQRTRNGLTASAQYTLAKATDNSNAFGNVAAGDSTAQNWLDLDGERGPSSFDQRHLFGTQVTYNTGVGLRGGAFLSGVKGKLIRGWTIDARMTTGSGMPFTPLYIQGTTLTPPLRANLTGATLTAPDGYYLNPAAYSLPAAGTFGGAGRNSARGPGTFTMDGSLQRSFPRGRLNFDLRIDATNLLNRVVYTNVGNLLENPQFGLPLGAGQMRKINTRLTVRF